MTDTQPEARARDIDPTGTEPAFRLGISACLLGQEVRFDGGHKRDLFLLNTLGEFVTWYPVCPEVEIGLGTPRESLRLRGTLDLPRLVGVKSGVDHTGAMNGWAKEKLDEIASWDIHGYVLKKDSPSCGLFRVRVYDEQEVSNRNGRGLFAKVLTERFPLLPVEEEGHLHDLSLRESFIERIFIYEHWTRLLRESPTPDGLVRFHTAHKLTILSRNPQGYRDLGRIVARAGDSPWTAIAEEYSRRLIQSLDRPATRGRHANVLLHLIGFVKDRLDREDKAELLGVIEDYRRGEVPLIVPVTLLKHHLRRHEVPAWVKQQVYLNPYPKELMLRNHV